MPWPIEFDDLLNLWICLSSMRGSGSISNRQHPAIISYLTGLNHYPEKAVRGYSLERSTYGSDWFRTATQSWPYLGCQWLAENATFSNAAGICVCIYIYYIHIYIYTSIYLSIYWSINLSIYLSTYLSMYVCM